ncbi:MAG: hypothetical protein ACRDIY_14505 [Chloroflexota bacterium]
MDALQASAPLVRANVQFLQARIGNQAVQRLLRAGSISLPRIQRNGTGIAADEASDQYVGEASSVITDTEWNRRNPKQRAQDLISLASRRLEALGMPRITGALGFNLSGGTNAAFIPAVWFIQMAERMVTDDRTAEGRARLVAAIYHEARHAEQYYRVAAMLARDGGKDAGTIKDELKLRADIAEAAAKDGAEQAQRKRPKKGTALAGEAERRQKEEAGWHQAMMLYQVMSQEKKKIDDEYDAAQRDYKRDPTDQGIQARYRMAWDQRRQAYIMYQKTAVELDAWAIQGRVEEKLGFTANTLETEMEDMARHERDPRLASRTKPQGPQEKAVGTPSVALGVYLTAPTIQSPTPIPSSATTNTPTGIGNPGRSRQRIIPPVQSLVNNTNTPSLPEATTDAPPLASPTSPSPLTPPTLTPTGIGNPGRPRQPIIPPARTLVNTNTGIGNPGRSRQRIIPPVQSLVNTPSLPGATTNTPRPDLPGNSPTPDAQPSSVTVFTKDTEDPLNLHLKRIQRHAVPPELDEVVADAKQDRGNAKEPDEDHR